MLLDIPTYDNEMIEGMALDSITADEINQSLKDYQEKYKKCFFNDSQWKYFSIFIRGLLSNLDRKTIEPIALTFMGETEVRGFQQFFKRSKLQDDTLLQKYQEILSKAVSTAWGMLCVDGSDFVKKGSDSVGVLRQYCGRLGKTENCQAGVFLSYASEQGYGLVDRKLYLPEAWFSEEYKDKWNRCHIPEETHFQTKNEIASELIQTIASKGTFQVKWIGCDAAFGCDHKFLESLPKALYYFAAVRENELVFPTMPQMIVPENEQGKNGRRYKHPRPSVAPVNVKVFAKDETIPWVKTVLGEGTKGLVIADIKCIRCVSCASTTKYGNYVAPGEEIWLYIRKYADGTLKYFLSNAPSNMDIATLNKVSTMRWSIEQCFQECKSYLGMSHYETRTYLAWHRHMLLVMITHLFTLHLRMALKKTLYHDANGKKADI